MFDENEGVFKVSVPRKDLSVIVAGVKMSPPMGLTSWAAFERDGKDDMVMGDMVMTEDQVSPVISLHQSFCKPKSPAKRKVR